MRWLRLAGIVWLVGAVFLLGVWRAAAQSECQRAKLTADDGAPGDLFGCSVGLSADVAIVGAWRHEITGAAYVFERSGTTWQLAAKLVTTGNGSGMHQGRSVAAEDNVIVLGANARWLGVFERDPNGLWSQVGELRPDEPTSDSLFGYAVSLSGDFAVVGAPHDDDNGYESGSAYIFERDPNGAWPQAAKLLPHDGEPYNHFGTAVAINGEVAAIGAPDDNDLGNWSGSAYVFERDPNGNWSEVAKLLPHDGAGFWNFGTSVAVRNDLILVGADFARGRVSYSGAAYVFERDPNGVWAETAKLVASDGDNSDYFGTSVALSGDLALIGARGDDDHGEASGSAYVFVPEADGTWSQVGKLVPDDGSTYDWFGNAVAVDGNTAVIGAYQDDDHGEDSGSAYVFAVGPDEDGNGVMDVCECLGDLDHDYDVDLADLAQLLSNYGMSEGAVYEDGDLDADGDVDLSDLAILLSRYGEVC